MLTLDRGLERDVSMLLEGLTWREHAYWLLLRTLGRGSRLADLVKARPAVRGRLSLESRADDRIVGQFVGDNIWTDTGREYLVELMSLAARSPRAIFRGDRVAYVGIGTGSQPEVAGVTSLVEPVVYRAATYLAPLDVPSTFPPVGSRTRVQFVREYGRTEISLGSTVVITEAGLFTDGDPDNDNDYDSTPVDYATTSGRAPVAYKATDPLTNTDAVTLRLLWEVSLS
jgi:hypothetical protein